MKELMCHQPTHAKVGITQVLAARDERALRQRTWLNQHGGALISFCINMPGEIKDNTEAHQLHMAGIIAVDQMIKQRGWVTVAHSAWHHLTGPEAFWSVIAPPLSLKEAMIQIECRHPLGRLFDLDVLDQTAKALSRRGFNLPPRQCLICSDLAAVCGRSRRHSPDELLTAIRHQLHQYSRKESQDVCMVG